MLSVLAAAQRDISGYIGWLGELAYVALIPINITELFCS